MNYEAQVFVVVPPHGICVSVCVCVCVCVCWGASQWGSSCTPGPTAWAWMVL